MPCSAFGGMNFRVLLLLFQDISQLKEICKSEGIILIFLETYWNMYLRTFLLKFTQNDERNWSRVLTRDMSTGIERPVCVSS
jgi:hypothetical protein